MMTNDANRMKTPISFRLRKYVDDDIAQHLAKVNEKEIADLCRNGLRLMLGIRTARQVEITERPLAIPPQVPAESTSSTFVVTGKSAVYVPKQKRS